MNITVDILWEFLNRKWTTPIILFFVCIIVFYSSFNYGFATDDFDGLIIKSWDQVLDVWKISNFRRPIDEIFYLIFTNLFGYNPIPYRLFIFVVYFVNTLLVYFLFRSLLKDQIIGSLIAIIFAANTVQFRNIYWVSCKILLFATLFCLVAAIYFLRYVETRQNKFLWISFSIALIGVITTKEDLIIFPLIAILLASYSVISTKGTLIKKDFVFSLRDSAIFWTIPFLFIGFRSAMSWLIGGEVGCPYNLLKCFKPDAGALHVSLNGFNMVRNIILQVYWNLGSLGIYWLDMPFNKNAGYFEYRNINGVDFFLILFFITVLIYLYWHLRKKISIWYMIIGIAWFVGALVPTLVLPEHVLPYFSAFPSIGLFLTFIIPLHNIIGSWSLKMKRIAITILVILFLGNSIYWIDTNEKLNWITSASVMTQKLEKGFKQLYSTFPNNTNILLPNLGRWWYIQDGRALKVMYNDLTLNVLSTEDFIESKGRIYTTKKVNLSKANSHAFFITNKGIHEVTEEFFRQYGGVLPQ